MVCPPNSISLASLRTSRCPKTISGMTLAREETAKSVADRKGMTNETLFMNAMLCEKGGIECER